MCGKHNVGRQEYKQRDKSGNYLIFQARDGAVWDHGGSRALEKGREILNIVTFGNGGYSN